VSRNIYALKGYLPPGVQSLKESALLGCYLRTSDPLNVTNFELLCNTDLSEYVSVCQRRQNHRMVGVGRDLCRSPSPTPCQSRVTYSRLHRTLSRRVWNISREGDSTTSLGSLCQGSVTLRGKKFFLMFRCNFLCFSL